MPARCISSSFPLSIQELEGMRPVRANRKQELKQELVRGDAFCVVRMPKLPAYLAELARPERQHARHAVVPQRAVHGTVRRVEAHAGEPPPGELVIRVRVVAERRLLAPDGRRLIAVAPDQLGPAEEALVDRTLQRTVAERRVDAVQPRVEV